MELIELVELLQAAGPALTDIFLVLVGWFSSIAVIKNQISALEKKVDKHNSVIERVYKLEQLVEDIDNKGTNKSDN